MENKKLDRRRKYYFVLDCETATLPFAQEYEGKARKKIGLMKPLIYDIAWQIMDASGKVYRQKSYLITEIFSVPQIFNTAYYASKRSIYLDKLKRGEIILTSWAQATAEMVADIECCEAVGAYNSMFDFKKAIIFTENYIDALYSSDYSEWENRQKWQCGILAKNGKLENSKGFDEMHFCFRGKQYPLFDIWGLACQNLLNNDDFRTFCGRNNLYSNSGKWYSTTAETAFRYLKDTTDFDEAHTALEDTQIECQILAAVFKQVKPQKMEMGIIYFPFRAIGQTRTEEEV